MTHKKSLALILSLMLLLIMGTIPRSYASHSTQHSHHHTPATHSTVVCSWMCAAAQTMSGDTQVISHCIQLIAYIEWPLPTLPSLISSLYLSTRAPPQ